MKTLCLLLMFSHAASTVKHSLEYFLTAFHGVPDLPEFVGAAVVDGVQIGYCDSNRKTAEPKHVWMKQMIKDDPKHLEWYSSKCFGSQHVFRANIEGLMQRFNQSEGAHILQRMNGCEWDDETGETFGFNQYGYDGEDFISLDLKTLTWTAPTVQALTTKLRCDTEKARLDYNKNYYIYMCPSWLKNYVHYGGSFLQRTELPLVSLLQKSPSSPVSCFATAFYPNRAAVFWRKDGEELHEDVEHGEILPNHDETFQMRSDINISSVNPEDWWRYECVFQLHGVKEDIITKLDKAVIRSNYEPPSTSLVPGLVVGLLLLLVSLTGIFIWSRNTNRFQPVAGNARGCC